MDAAEDPSLLDELWLAKKPGGDFKKTWKEIDDNYEETEVEVDMGCAQQAGHSWESPQENDKRRKRKKAQDKKLALEQEKAKKQEQAKAQKIQKYEEQIDACSEACDKALAKKESLKNGNLSFERSEGAEGC